MRRLSLLAAILLASLTGCDAVTVNEPFGDSPSREFREALRGTWTGPEGDVFHIETDKDARLILGVTQWDADKEKFEMKNTPMTLKVVGKRPLLFFPASERVDDRFMFLWLSHIDDTSINARACNPKIFRESVESGQISGEVIQVNDGKNFEVRLKPSDALLKQLATPQGDKYFISEKGDQPLRRLGERDDR